MDLEDGAPENLICPLSLCLLEDVVIAMDGISYSRRSIQAYIDYCAEKGKPLTSPMTGEKMEGMLVPNVMARAMVLNYVQKKKEELESKRGGARRRRAGWRRRGKGNVEVGKRKLKDAKGRDERGDCVKEGLNCHAPHELVNRGPKKWLRYTSQRLDNIFGRIHSCPRVYEWRCSRAQSGGAKHTYTARLLAHNGTHLKPHIHTPTHI